MRRTVIQEGRTYHSAQSLRLQKAFLAFGAFSYHSLLRLTTASQELVPMGLSLPQFYIWTLFNKTKFYHQTSGKSRKQKEKNRVSCKGGTLTYSTPTPEAFSIFSVLSPYRKYAYRKVSGILTCKFSMICFNLLYIPVIPSAVYPLKSSKKIPLGRKTQKTHLTGYL